MRRRALTAIAIAMAASLLTREALAQPKDPQRPERPVADETRKPPVVQLPPRPPIRPGEAGTITLTIAGTRRPVRVKVRDRNGVVAVPDRTFVSTGGDTNTVEVSVTGVTPGEPDLEIKLVEDGGASERGEDLQAAFRTQLQRILREARELADRAEWKPIPPGRRTYALNDVLSVLSFVSEEINKSLPQRELMAFRDGVHDFMRTLSDEATAAALSLPRDSSRGERAAGIILVAYPPETRAPRIDKSKGDSIFARIFDFLSGAAEAPLVRELCVRTVPDGYEIKFFPPSYPPDSQTVRAASRLSLNAGKYGFEIRPQGRNRESSGTVDLLLNRQVLIECPVRFDPNDPQACRFLDGAASPCP